jgi:hypothetical protein
MVWHLIRGKILPFISAIIYSEVKGILIRLPHLFLDDLLAVVRYSSTLKASSGISPEKPNMTGSNIKL